LYYCGRIQDVFYIIKMPSFRLNPRILHRALQSRTYATAQAPAINVTNVPAPHCGSIRILSLNRPAARNAISRQLLAELSHQVNSIHNEGDNGSTRALILASDVDTSFCAGADLKERAKFTQEEYVQSLERLPRKSTANKMLERPIF
jgi:methylglutaconyl-CoA hydratase